MDAIPDPGPVPERTVPPSGTVTFVFADVEAGLPQPESELRSPGTALRRYHVLVHEQIGEHAGYVFKTVGDAFYAAFRRPQDALGAMLATQRALGQANTADLNVCVRAAIHTGTADERDGDYFGPTLNRVARLLSIGHRGQLLVSGATAALAREELPAQATLNDLGLHRLKDLARPEHVFELRTPGTSVVFPPLRSLDAVPNNLPHQATSFIGREMEIAEITASLAANKLVTLVGSGGLGKTRIALQVAANSTDAWPDGVWFIELAPLANGTYLASTISGGLRLTLPAFGDPLEHLVHALKMKHALLIVDNCEHLIADVAHIVAALLRGCPQLKILASSRQALGIVGERTYRMASLRVPAAGAPVNEAMSYPAIELFVERACAVDRNFELTAVSASIVAEICRRLDGIPLAIELAAARVKILSVSQIRDRLHERFRVLTGGRRDALPRQQTLRALIDWSYDLLDERERGVFRRLGIFVNGFTLEGAVAIAGDDDLDEFEVLDVLASLVDKSLVQAEPAGDVVRYVLLESTRAYAGEKRAVAGDDASSALRHLGYLRDLFGAADAWFARTARTTELVNLLVTELADVRAAADRALGNSDLVTGAELVVNTADAWRNAGLAGEALSRNEAFLKALPAAESRLRARLSIAAALDAAVMLRSTHVVEHATNAVEYARRAGESATLAAALGVYAQIMAWMRRPQEAAAALAEAEAIGNHNAMLRIRLLNVRVISTLFTGDLAAAAQTTEQLRQEHHALGNVSQALSAGLNLADIEHARGRTARAIAIAREVLPALRELQHHVHLSHLLANYAGYLAASDDREGARVAALQAIAELAPHQPDSPFIVCAIEHLALTSALAAAWADAALFAGFAQAAYCASGSERQHTESCTYERLTGLLRAGVPPDTLAELLAQGEALTTQTAIDRALGLRTPPVGCAP